MRELNKFIFFESYYKKYNLLKQKNPKLATRILEIIVQYGLYGEYKLAADDDELLIESLLSEVFALQDSQNTKYQMKVQATKESKAQGERLEEIAELLKQGKTQRDIAAIMGITQSAVSKRISTIRTEYSYLLD